MSADRRAGVSAPLYAAICALTIAAGLGAEAAASVAAWLLAAFLILELPRVPGAQRWVGGGLMLLGLMIGALAGQPLALALAGLRQALPFLVLFAAVLCLQVPAAASPSLRRVGGFLLRQPPGRRALAVAVGSHLLGAALNFAGLQFVGTVLERAAAPDLRARLGAAMTRGFAAAAFWSPLFVAGAVILSMSPGLSWIDIGPAGLALAALVIGLSVLAERRRAPAAAPAETGRLGRGVGWRLLALFVGLVVPVLAAVEAAGLDIAIALGLVVPVFAAVWYGLIHAAPPLAAAAAIAGHARRRLAELRTEALVFTGASLLGVALAALLRQEPLPAGLLPSGPPALAAVTLTTTALGLAGVHPVVSTLVIGQAFPAALLGVSPTGMALALMAGWGLGTMVSPLSATTMYAARLLHTTVWAVAWRWNAVFGLSTAVLTGGLLAAGEWLAG